MRTIIRKSIAVFAFVAPLAGGAQTQHFGTDADKRPYIP